MVSKLAKIASTPAAAIFVAKELQLGKRFSPRTDKSNSESAVTVAKHRPFSCSIREHKSLVFLFGAMLLVALPTFVISRAGIPRLRSLRALRAFEAPSEKPTTPPEIVPVHSGDTTATVNPVPQAIHLTNIDWLSKITKTKVVIRLDGAATFETHRLRNPDRIFVDLYPTRLSPALSSRTEKLFQVDDRFVERLRVAQKGPLISRVVVDLKIRPRYAKVSLVEPNSLMIAVLGARDRRKWLLGLSSPLRRYDLAGDGALH
jgi:hypothetical protein